MVCLAFAGNVIAGVYYFAVDLPQQKSLQVPTNNFCSASQIANLKSSCAKHGPGCYECVAVGEHGFGCEISGTDALSACRTKHEPVIQCDSSVMFCKTIG